jgi:hypothetical protein
MGTITVRLCRWPAAAAMKDAVMKECRLEKFLVAIISFARIEILYFLFDILRNCMHLFRKSVKKLGS